MQKRSFPGPKSSGIRVTEKGAIATLNEALVLDSWSARTLVARGNIKDELGDHDGAIVDYNAAIGSNPGYEYTYRTKCDTENGSTGTTTPSEIVNESDLARWDDWRELPVPRPSKIFETTTT